MKLKFWAKGPTRDTITGTTSPLMAKYAEKTMRDNIFDREAFMRVLWAGRLVDPMPEGWVPPPPPSRWLRLRWWLAAHRPTFHIGPCDHEYCD